MEPWFTEQQAGLVGGILGGVIGGVIGGGLGGSTRWLVKKGWRRLTMTLYGLSLCLGLALLGIGTVAIYLKQPYHVWYPFLLTGVIVSGITSAFVPMIRMLFAQEELRKMQSEDL